MLHSFVRHPGLSQARRGSRGFTLIEVMVTVGIVAILAGVAVPIYADNVRRSQVQEGFASLADFRAKMEQYYLDNRHYGAAACADVNPPANWPAFPATKYFTYACVLSGATSTGGRQQYTVTATGTAAGRAQGHVYSIGNNPRDNTQVTTQFKGNPVAKPCWLAKGDEC